MTDLAFRGRSQHLLAEVVRYLIAATAGLNRNNWIVPTARCKAACRRRCKRVGGALPAARAKYSPGAGAMVQRDRLQTALAGGLWV